MTIWHVLAAVYLFGAGYWWRECRSDGWNRFGAALWPFAIAWATIVWMYFRLRRHF